MIFYIIIAEIIISSSVCLGNPDQTFQVYYENDGTVFKPDFRQDRHYTNGAKVVYTNQEESDWLKAFAKWNHFGDYNRPVDTDFGIFFGQSIYTPDHIHNPEARDKKDMQFAGWIYSGIFAQRASNDEMEHFELDFGMIGPVALGGPTQKFVHNTLNIDLPRGWENQLGDEFHSDFTWFKRQRSDALFFKHTKNFDSYMEYGFTAGTLRRNAFGGVIFRLGYDLQDDFGPGRVEAPACATYRKAKGAVPIYLFARFGGKLVEYNRFLTGLDTEPAVGVMQLGFVT